MPIRILAQTLALLLITAITFFPPNALAEWKPIPKPEICHPFTKTYAQWGQDQGKDCYCAIVWCDGTKNKEYMDHYLHPKDCLKACYNWANNECQDSEITCNTAQDLLQ